MRVENASLFTTKNNAQVKLEFYLLQVRRTLPLRECLWSPHLFSYKFITGPVSIVSHTHTDTHRGCLPGRCCCWPLRPLTFDLITVCGSWLAAGGHQAHLWLVHSGRGAGGNPRCKKAAHVVSRTLPALLHGNAGRWRRRPQVPNRRCLPLQQTSHTMHFSSYCWCYLFSILLKLWF